MTEITVTISGNRPIPPPVTIVFQHIDSQNFDGSISKNEGRQIYRRVIQPLPAAAMSAIKMLINREGGKSRPKRTNKERWRRSNKK